MSCRAVLIKKLTFPNGTIVEILVRYLPPALLGLNPCPKAVFDRLLEYYGIAFLWRWRVLLRVNLLKYTGLDKEDCARSNEEVATGSSCTLHPNGKGAGDQKLHHLLDMWNIAALGNN